VQDVFRKHKEGEMGLNLDSGRERNKWLQIRVSEDELATVKELAEAYDQDVSDFVRNMIRWIDDKRPELRIAPKELALA
jgi:hypothetical protein